jgi:microcystin-dependent protein
MPLDPLIGNVMLFAGNFAPRGWAFCDGSLLSIADNTALFSLLGVTYGGDGQTTFGLPDLRGRVPIHFGQGAGLSNRVLGELGGVENVTVLQTELPQHSHVLTVSSAAATTGTPSSGVTLAVAAEELYSGDSPNNSLNANTISSVGGSQPHPNVQPVLALNFVIATEGIYPSRN